MVDRSFVERNAAATHRLASLVAELRDADLALSVDREWTIAAVLAHLTFWDQRALVLLERWEGVGVAPSPIDVDAVNEAALPQWRALPPRAVADRVIAVATTVDARLAALPDATLEAVAAAGNPINTDRSVHRHGHLDAIERALTAADPARRAL
jgi:hypothetical protein